MPRGSTRYYPQTTLYDGLTLNWVCRRPAQRRTHPTNINRSYCRVLRVCILEEASNQVVIMMLGGVYLLWRMTMRRAVSGARPANT